MKRAIVLALSVILALVMAAPVATAQSSSTEPSLAELTASWWSWVAATDPSPLEGGYQGGEQCDGQFIDGVFFLSGSNTSGNVHRTCTVPDDTPILLPVFNTICSEAWTDPKTGKPSDPKPYPKCATNLLEAGGTDMFATLQKTGEAAEDLDIQRISSGSFEWTIGEGFDAFLDNDGSLLEAGTYNAGADGYWVYLEDGLEPGTYTLNFGGDFFKQPKGKSGYSPNVTYRLIVE